MKSCKLNTTYFLTATFTLLLFVLWASPAFGHRSPDTCNGSGLNIMLFVDKTEARIGDIISYSVTVLNGTGGVNTVCDATGISASILTPDDRNHTISLSRRELSHTERDTYSNVVTYTAHSRDLNMGTFVATASVTGTIHQNDTNSLGGGEQSVKTTLISTPTSVVVPPVVPPVVVPSVTVTSSGGGGGGGGFLPLPLINITKVPNPLALPDGPGLVTYTYTATNVGKIEMMWIWVKDDLCAPVSFISGDSNNDAKLDINEAWVYQCTKTVSQTETNTATAHGGANGWDGYDTALATVIVGERASVIPPLIHLVKKPDVFTLIAPGGAVTYTYTVTNPGTAPLHDVSVTDDKCTGTLGLISDNSGDLNRNNLLEHNEVWTVACTTNLTRTTTNIGIALGRANGLTAVDSSSATVLVVAPKLPNAGIGPDDSESSLWKFLIPTILLLIVSLYFEIRSRSRI